MLRFGFPLPFGLILCSILREPSVHRNYARLDGYPEQNDGTICNSYNL